MPKTKAAQKSKGLTAEERAAMKATARERKLELTKADWEKELLTKIAEMPPKDRALAKKVHAIVKANAPDLSPKTWYGMPAYVNKDGKVVCYFKSAFKFQTRYAQLGFEDAANLDDGGMWPTVFGVTNLTAAEEKKIAALVKRAVG